jgi:hypothetical protein
MTFYALVFSGGLYDAIALIILPVCLSSVYPSDSINALHKAKIPQFCSFNPKPSAETLNYSARFYQPSHLFQKGGQYFLLLFSLFRQHPGEYAPIKRPDCRTISGLPTAAFPAQAQISLSRVLYDTTQSLSNYKQQGKHHRNPPSPAT